MLDAAKNCKLPNKYLLFQICEFLIKKLYYLSLKLELIFDTN